MKIEDQVDLVVVIKDQPSKNVIRGRVVRIDAKAAAEWSLVGLQVRIQFEDAAKPHLVLKSGILVRVTLGIDAVNGIINRIADGSDYEELTVTDLRPLNEPCVRIPLSLFSMLRGQDATSEYERRALETAWSQDRRTGR